MHYRMSRTPCEICGTDKDIYVFKRHINPKYYWWQDSNDRPSKIMRLCGKCADNHCTETGDDLKHIIVR
jgi:hypothetical protein